MCPSVSKHLVSRRVHELVYELLRDTKSHGIRALLLIFRNSKIHDRASALRVALETVASGLRTSDDREFELCFDLLNTTSQMIDVDDDENHECHDVVSTFLQTFLKSKIERGVRVIRVITILLRFRNVSIDCNTVLDILRRILRKLKGNEDVFIATCQTLYRFSPSWRTTRAFWNVLNEDLTALWLKSTSDVSMTMYVSLLRKCLFDEKNQDQRDLARQIISRGGLALLLSNKTVTKESRALCTVLCCLSGLARNDFNNVPNSLSLALDQIAHVSSAVETSNVETTLMMIWLTRLSETLGYRDVDDVNDLTTRDVLSSLIESRSFFNLSSRSVAYTFFTCASLYESGTTIAPMSSEVLFRRAQIERVLETDISFLEVSIRKSQRQNVMLFAYHLIVSLSEFQGNRDRSLRRAMLRDAIDLFHVQELQHDEKSMFQRLTARSVEFSEPKRKNFVRDVLSCCCCFVDTDSKKDSSNNLRAAVFFLRFTRQGRCLGSPSFCHFLLREIINVMRLDRLINELFVIENKDRRDLELERISVLLHVVCTYVSLEGKTS